MRRRESTRILAELALWGTLAVALAGCQTSDEESGDSNTIKQGPIKVTVTVGMLADLVRRVGGEHVEVTQLLGPGTDPHTYRPQRDDAVRLASADLVFYNGHLLEGKLATQLSSRGSKNRHCAVAEAVDQGRLLSSNTESGAAGAIDPHLWMDASLWLAAAQVVRDELSKYDPEHREQYLENYEALAEELKLLQQYGQELAESVPKQQRVLITSHDAFRYFGRAYGFEVEAVQGLSTESEAGLNRVLELVDLIVERKIGAVFIESSVPSDSIEVLVKNTAQKGQPVRIAGTLFSDAMGKPGEWEGTYVGMMDHNLTTIARELGGGNVPPGGFRQWQSLLKNLPATDSVGSSDLGDESAVVGRADG